MDHLKHLILIDDDNIVVYLTKRIVADTNMVELTNVFGNGEDALNYLKENLNNPDALPEIIFLDLFMPILDGWQFLEEFNLIKSEISKPITIYVITSSVSREDYDKVKQFNTVSDYIVKPITKANFIEVIKKVS